MTSYNISDLPGTLPRAHIPEDISPTEIAEAAVSQLSSLKNDSLAHDAIWRDSLALTGDLRTFYSASNVASAWNDAQVVLQNSAMNFSLVPGSAHISRHDGEYAWIQAGFQFETMDTTGLRRLCSGGISLVPATDTATAADGKIAAWKIWVLTTVLENFAGYGNVDVLVPRSSPTPVLPYWEEAAQKSSFYFDAVVVGGGQSGLSAGGRLHALGINYVVIDKHRQIGDNWDTRYESLKLHTVREYAHLPFERTFDSSYPQWLGKGDLAKGYRAWVEKYGINVWTSTGLLSCSQDNASQNWTLTLERSGQEIVISSKHVIFAMGTLQGPYMPEYPHRELFKGDVLHSADYKSSSEWRGKNGVIIGTANTGHDIAEDMLDAGLESVTMIQRSKTWILPQKNSKIMQEVFYNANIPTELADRLSMSGPLSINRQLTMHYLHKMARSDPDSFDALEAVGFKTERFGDLFYAIFQRGGGHYMDTGDSAKIAQELIKIKSDSLPKAYTSNGLLLEDGSVLEADVIVFATGFDTNMRDMVGEFVGPDVKAKLSDFWGLDEEGEIRGAYKFTGYPRLWYAGGDVAVARYYSRFLALQIKADLLGSPLKRYMRRFAAKSSP